MRCLKNTDRFLEGMINFMSRIKIPFALEETLKGLSSLPFLFLIKKTYQKKGADLHEPTTATEVTV